MEVLRYTAFSDDPASGNPAEVSFCGHATIATAVALAHLDGPGDLHYATMNGRVDVTTRTSGDGTTSATLTSVARGPSRSPTATSTTTTRRSAR